MLGREGIENKSYLATQRVVILALLIGCVFKEFT